MNINQAFGFALKQLRNHYQLTQEDFSEVSSRTYISSLERGLKSPTIEKIDELATVIGVHPALMLLLAYAHLDETSVKHLCEMLNTQGDSVLQRLKEVPNQG